MMRILHYGLGYAPERSGGLIQYISDLMQEQVSQGQEVAYLFPGKINLASKKSKIIQSKERIKNVRSYELINSLPLALFGGIDNPLKFMEKADSLMYERLLEQFQPDIVHVHTLMGIHKEFFEVAKEKKIRIIFTSHDYFGLSPNPTFYFNNKSWDSENTLNYWLNVSQGAMSIKKLKIVQFPFYAKLRDFIKKFKRESFQKEKKYQILENSMFEKDKVTSFQHLRNYYREIFSMINFFHFNSLVAKETFLENLDIKSHTYAVVAITNREIQSGIKEICADFTKIKKVTYIGQYANFKGFNNFLKLAEKLQSKKIEFEIYGENIDVKLPRNVANQKRYSRSMRDSVFNNMQLLIIPSNWKETYGFLALEAASFQVPTIISSNVGAKVLFPQDFIFENGKLEEKISRLFNDKIKLNFEIEIESFDKHTKKIIDLYEKIINKKDK